MTEENWGPSSLGDFRTAPGQRPQAHTALTGPCSLVSPGTTAPSAVTTVALEEGVF